MAYIYPIIKNNFTQYTVYYLYKSKKIYIGIYNSEIEAQEAYNYTNRVFREGISIETYSPGRIAFQKFITLVNFRDHGMFINHPIYVCSGYFKYFFSEEVYLILDLKDLFYFSTYKIYRRGHYLYTSSSHSQQSILTRFGITPKSTYGKDYMFVNGNRYDLRRENIIVLNHYHGVSCKIKDDKPLYTTRIYHEKNIVVGHYTSEIQAAIAYNKAAHILLERGVCRTYPLNTIPYLTQSEYDSLYVSLSLSPRLSNPSIQKKVASHKLYRGTYKDKSGFRACIGYQGKQIYLGNYPTEVRAAQAYNFASFYLYGKEGHVNQVTPLIYDTDDHIIYKKLQKAGVLKEKSLRD
ncbi:MAG: hypothetical protein ACRCTE_10360 [Cellulosilyticaceae bacterium]